MNIPKAIKIGGVTYAVKITDKLAMGSANYSGEIDYTNLEIRICPNARQKQEVDLLHELLLGYAYAAPIIYWYFPAKLTSGKK